MLNEIVDAILNQKNQIARDRGIRIQVQGRMAAVESAQIVVIYPTESARDLKFELMEDNLINSGSSMIVGVTVGLLFLLLFLCFCMRRLLAQ